MRAINRPSNSDDGPEAITRAASLWLERTASCSLSSDERAAFAKWIAEPAHREVYERLERTLQNVHSARNEVGVARMRAETRARVERIRARRRRAVMAASLAIVFATGVTSTLWFADQVLQDEQSPLAGDAHGAPIKDVGRTGSETTTGERLTVILEDGTEVMLNTRTRIAIHYSDAERLVELPQGQALFNVADDKARPFIVDVGDQRVRAIATEFDVRRAAAGVQVTLIKGRVAVEEMGISWPNMTRPEPVHVAELAPGEQFVTHRSGATAEIREVNIERVTSWRLGRLIFRNDTLGDAVAEANRYARRPIELADEQMAALRISGSFPTDRIDAFVEALTRYFPIAEAQTREARHGVARRLEWREQPGG